MRALTHKGFQHAVDNFTALVRLLMQAKKVIIMDALLSNKTINLIKNIDNYRSHGIRQIIGQKHRTSRSSGAILRDLREYSIYKTSGVNGGKMS